MSIYTDEGFKSRNDYLLSLSDESGVPLFIVRELAELLGENEDFDGLVIAVQEYDFGDFGDLMRP